MDGMYAPSAIAALACLFYALLVKAVEISRYGLLEVGDAEWVERTERIKEAMLNGRGGYDGPRVANTSKLYKYHDVLIDEATDLVRQLKHILFKLGPCYPILEKLAEKPIALRRCDGQRWKEIESDLAVEPTAEDELQLHLRSFIDLHLVSECASLQEWIIAVSDEMREDPDIEMDSLPEDLEDAIGKYVAEKQSDGEMIWSEKLGSVMNIRA
jgi:hypothetical protein